MLTVVATAAPALWRTDKTILVSGHSLHQQKPSPVSKGFAPPAMAAQIDFRPEALAAAMARTLTLRMAPDAFLAHWARSQLAQIEYLVADGSHFELSPLIEALADAERSGFAGRVGAGVTDLLMNALGYVWRDNAACLSGKSSPHADFIYGGGAASGHGVVLAEARGSFAQSVTKGTVGGEARRKYLRQVKPHIASICTHGKVIHGYSVAFGSNPTRHDTYLHVAETNISKRRRKIGPPAQQSIQAGAGQVSTSLALAAHRSNFLLVGASQIVAWIDWLRGAPDRPVDDPVTPFLTFDLSGRRFLVAAERFFPDVRPWFFPDVLDPSLGPWMWEQLDRWRSWRQPAADNVFAMEEQAAEAFLALLSRMIGGGREQMPAALDLPIIRTTGLFSGPDHRSSRDEDARYPVAQFLDGLALLGKLPRRASPGRRFWSPERGLE